MATAFLTGIDDPRFNDGRVEVLLSVALYDDANASVSDANTSVQFVRNATLNQIQRAIVAAIIIRAGQRGVVVSDSDVFLLVSVDRGGKAT